jgi:glycosyltransferase involved in cell wall biosynthesis
MRISLACFHPSRLSGQVRAAVHLSRALSARGHRVRLLTACDFDEASANHDHGPLAARVPSVFEAMRGFAHVLHQLTVADRNDDVIQLNLPSPGFAYVGDALRAVVRRPIVVSFEAQLMSASETWSAFLHEWSLDHLFPLAVNNAAVARLSRFSAARYVVSSQTQAREIVALGASPESIRIIPTIVHLAPVERTCKEDQDVVRPTITYIGHFDYVKGVDVLVRALPLVQKRFPGARLLLAWSGLGPSAGVRRAIRETGVERSVDLVGHVAVRDTLLCSTVCALPYRTTGRQEAFPLVLVEALTTGVPLVTTDLPLIRELIEPGREAIFARPGDATNLADAIVRLLDDEPLRRSIVAWQRRIVRPIFEPGALVAQYEQVYRECLEPANQIGSIQNR